MPVRPMRLEEVVKALLEDPDEEERVLNQPDGRGKRPVDYAIANEESEMVAMLITAGGAVTPATHAEAVRLDMDDIVEAAQGDFQAMMYATTQTVSRSAGLHPRHSWGTL